MIPALAQVCSLPSPLEKDVEDYAAGKCPAIEVWLTKLEEFVETHSVDRVRDLLDRFDISMPVASFQGGLLETLEQRRQEAWAQFAKRLELCRELGIETLVVAGDFPNPISSDDVEQGKRSLQQIAQEAESKQAKIALEFQARSAFCNNLRTAVSLIDDINHPSLGLCLDAFHFCVGPSKTEDLVCLSQDNLYHVQLCDVADIPREFATDSHRILPGDGDFHLTPIIQRLRSINYTGHVAIETMNPQIWQVPALQFGEIGMTALRKLLGQSDNSQTP